VAVFEASRFRHLTEQHPPLRTMTVAYDQFFLAQIEQTAACNAAHRVEARTYKRLLPMQRLEGNDLPLTQEFLLK
jgi:hypothetical protein